MLPLIGRIWIGLATAACLALSGCSAGATRLATPAPPATAIPLSPTAALTVTASFPPLATLTAVPPVAAPTRTPSLTPSPAPTLPPTEPVSRGPYLQSAAPGSIWVVWDTARPSAGWVKYGPAPALEQVALETQSGLHHAVQLTGLQPYIQVAYQPGGDPDPHTFRSPPAPGQTAFRFAVLGDTRSNTQVHSAIVAGIAAARPDLVLHTGDLVDDGSNAGEWDSFLKIEAPLMQIAPLYPTLGNHEGGAPAYFQIFRLPGYGQWYSFDYADARFIILKADAYRPADFAPGAEQRVWLEAQLASAAGHWIFVSFHVPLHTSFAEDPSEVNLRKALAPLFEKNKVTAVFNGHIHSYERVLENGVTYIVTGGGGAPLYSLGVREPGQQAAALLYHFVLLDIIGNRLTGQAIDKDGKVIDSFEITATRP